MKYVLVFVLLTCVLSASIKERMETVATEKAQEETLIQSKAAPTNKVDCETAGGDWLSNGRVCTKKGCSPAPAKCYFNLKFSF
jgi:hypothetical protein